MLDSHEFLRDVVGDGVPDFGRLPFNVIVFSVELLLAKLGRPGVAFADAGSSALCPFCAFFDSSEDVGEP